MGMPAARITDLHTCAALVSAFVVPPAGAPIVTGCFTVLTGKLPQARVTDNCVCVAGTDMIVKGSLTVLVGGLPAARIGDLTALGGVIITGLVTVLIGDAGAGGGGAGGGGTGQGAVEDLAASGPGMPTHAEQAKVLRDAAKSGTPFCERCMKAAAKAKAAAAHKAAKRPRR